MALANEQAVPITGFKGLDKSSAVAKPGYTRSLLNVTVRDQKVTGRGGVDYDSTFSAVMSENILGLMPYITESTLATTLLRIGRTKVEKSTSGAWTDITGTALTAASDIKPQWANFRNTLYFTNEGTDDPRSWTGSGNTAALSGAPKAKGIMSYYGYLFLLHIYDSNDAAFKTRRAQYSQTPDTDWSACASNLLNFEETPGALLAGIPFGEYAAMLKEDGVVILHWVGGKVVFTQKLLKGAPGTLAPLAAQPIAGEKGSGIIYLGKDYQLVMADSNTYEHLPPNVNKLLQSTLYKANVANCRSAILQDRETYSLFFPTDSSGNQGRIDYNYRTGEFAYSTYADHDWAAMQTVRWTKTSEESLIGAAGTRPYTLDVQTVATDETSSTTNTPSRYYDTDWMMAANINEGRVIQTAIKFTGATLVFEALSYGKCSISVAFDHKNTFRFEKKYDLRPKNVGDEYVQVRYDIPPTETTWVNLRIKFHPSVASNPTLLSGALHYIPEAEKTDVRRTASSVPTA